MSTKNLWGSLEGLKAVRTPTVILQEQAGLLGQLTDEVLEAKVLRSTPSGPRPQRVMSRLYIVAPALQEYRVSVLSVEYSIVAAYPVIVKSSIDGIQWTADSERELENILRQILSSESVKNIIFSLIAESELSSEE